MRLGQPERRDADPGSRFFYGRLGASRPGTCGRRWLPTLLA
jgi:hypothetical protein